MVGFVVLLSEGAGSDIVESYRKACNLVGALVKPIDGRTMQGLTRQIGVCKKHDHTMPIAEQLQAVKR